MIRRLFFDLRSTRRGLLLVAFLAMVALPVINYYQMRDFSPLLVMGDVLAQAQLILPLACALPVALLLYRRLEEGTMEVMHTMPAVFSKGGLSLLLYELFCLQLTLPVFCWYASLYGVFLWPEWLRTLAQALFLQNLAYAAAYLSRLHLAGIAGQILAVGFFQYPLTTQNPGIFAHINIYELVNSASPRPWNSLRVLLTVIAAALLWLYGAKKENFFLD